MQRIILVINRYLDESIEAVEQALTRMPDRFDNDWKKLNLLFREIISFAV